jgi:hypothetical protein
MGLDLKMRWNASCGSTVGAASANSHAVIPSLDDFVVPRKFDLH